MEQPGIGRFTTLAGPSVHCTLPLRIIRRRRRRALRQRGIAALGLLVAVGDLEAVGLLVEVLAHGFLPAHLDAAVALGEDRPVVVLHVPGLGGAPLGEDPLGDDPLLAQDSRPLAVGVVL